MHKPLIIMWKVRIWFSLIGTTQSTLRSKYRVLYQVRVIRMWRPSKYRSHGYFYAINVMWFKSHLINTIQMCSVPRIPSSSSLIFDHLYQLFPARFCWTATSRTISVGASLGDEWEVSVDSKSNYACFFPPRQFVY